MIISELSVDYMSFDDDDKEISGLAISYKDNSGKEQRRWLEKPRRIGHWIYDCAWDEEWYICSNCKRETRIPNYKFCPCCGAKMDESEGNNNE